MNEVHMLFVCILYLSFDICHGLQLDKRCCIWRNCYSHIEKCIPNSCDRQMYFFLIWGEGNTVGNTYSKSSLTSRNLWKFLFFWVSPETYLTVLFHSLSSLVTRERLRKNQTTCKWWEVLIKRFESNLKTLLSISFHFWGVGIVICIYQILFSQGFSFFEMSAFFFHCFECL